MKKKYRVYSTPKDGKIDEYFKEVDKFTLVYPSKPELLINDFLKDVNKLSYEFKEEYSAKDIPKIWDKAGKECIKLCEENLDVLSATTKFPEEALRLYVKNIFDNLKEDYLLKIVKGEIGNLEYLDKFAPSIVGYAKAYGPKYAVHIFPETIGPQPLSTFQTGVIKTPAICKPSSGEPIFTTLWIDSLKEVDENIGKYIWSVPWKGGNEKIEDKLFGNEDSAIIVYGDNITIDNVKSKSKGNVLEYPFKAGIEIIKINNSEEINEIATKLVKDISYMDQCACFSPHVVYVIGSPSDSKKLCEKMAKELDNCPIKRKKIGVDEKSVISMLKYTYLLEKSAGLDVEVYSGKDSLIIYEEDPSFQLSPLFRTIRVKPIKNIGELVDLLYGYKNYLQTIGTNLKEKEKIADFFEDYGISRVVDIGKMPINKLHHHEGRPLILPLIRWVDVE
mgnify:CR=1 FL=1